MNLNKISSFIVILIIFCAADFHNDTINISKAQTFNIRNIPGTCKNLDLAKEQVKNIIKYLKTVKNINNLNYSLLNNNINYNTISSSTLGKIYPRFSKRYKKVFYNILQNMTKKNLFNPVYKFINNTSNDIHVCRKCETGDIDRSSYKKFSLINSRDIEFCKVQIKYTTKDNILSLNNQKDKTKTSSIILYKQNNKNFFYLYDINFMGVSIMKSYRKKFTKFIKKKGIKTFLKKLK